MLLYFIWFFSSVWLSKDVSIFLTETLFLILVSQMTWILFYILGILSYKDLIKETCWKICAVNKCIYYAYTSFVYLSKHIRTSRLKLERLWIGKNSFPKHETTYAIKWIGSNKNPKNHKEVNSFYVSGYFAFSSSSYFFHWKFRVLFLNGAINKFKANIEDGDWKIISTKDWAQGKCYP